VNSKLIKLMVTIGPSSNSERIFRIMKNKSVDFIRLNMSHSSIEDLKYSTNLANNVGIDYVLDTEGAQIRSGLLDDASLFLQEGEYVQIYVNSKVMERFSSVSNDSTIIAVDKISNKSFFLTPIEAIKTLSLGDLVYIDNFGPIISVVDVSTKSSGYIIGKVIANGELLNKKAVFVDKAFESQSELSVLSAKDEEAIGLGLKENISNIAVSYVRSGADVDLVKEVTNNKMRIISKIENRLALINLEEIIEKSDFLLIDRGDMSKEIPVEKIPFIQRYILDRCKSNDKGVFVATNLLESMVSNSKPTRAEIQDVTIAALDGFYGLTLSAETAVGKHPIRSINTMNRVIAHVEGIKKNSPITVDAMIDDFNLPLDYLNEHFASVPIEPFGGILVRIGDMDINDIEFMPKIVINEDSARDIFQIAVGAFSPISGFMHQDDLHSVITNMQLSNGLIWPLPITLDIEESDGEAISIGEDCCLLDSRKRPLATMRVQQIYNNQKALISKAVFGTEDPKHLGVERVLNQKPFLLAGELISINPTAFSMGKYEFTPRQLRKLFYEKGWEKIAGFHTRNVAHRGHEYILSRVIEDEFCDGVLLHPVVGSKKKGDFNSKYILKSYEMMLKNYLMKDRFVLSAFGTYSRYGGPREAIFTAICRKNFGCTHFIVGRDHTGIANYYGSSNSKEVFDKIGDIGIEIIAFDEVVYSKKQKCYIQTDLKDEKKSRNFYQISGTEFRKSLLQNQLPQSWLARREIAQMLLKSISRGEKVFVE